MFCILLSLPLVSFVSDQCECRERESEQLNERNSSLSSCASAIEVIPICCLPSLVAAKDRTSTATTGFNVSHMVTGYHREAGCLK